MGQSRFQDAYGLFEEALEHAHRIGDPRLVDLALCGRAAAALELDGREELIAPLRQILLRSSDDESRFLASYNISRAYDRVREYRKALFYARLALDHALRLNRSEWVGSSLNQIANQLLSTSFFGEACNEYEKALDLLPEDALLERALIFDNLGYCRVVQGRLREGFQLLFWSLRTLRRLSARRYQAYPRLGLCVAYLEIGRYRHAMKHGYRALHIAQTEGDTEATKLALYLLGETAKLAGATAVAHRFFRRLQSDFYPDDGFLPEMLLSVDVRRLINLRA